MGLIYSHQRGVNLGDNGGTAASRDKCYIRVLLLVALALEWVCLLPAAPQLDSLLSGKSSLIGKVWLVFYWIRPIVLRPESLKVSIQWLNIDQFLRNWSITGQCKQLPASKDTKAVPFTQLNGALDRILDVSSDWQFNFELKKSTGVKPAASGLTL